MARTQLTSRSWQLVSPGKGRLCCLHLDVVNSLRVAVSRERLTLLVQQEVVPLAALIQERIRFFEQVVTFSRDAQVAVGNVNVSGSTAALTDRCLGDLLHNAAEHGGSNVHLSVAVENSVLTMVIADDGPGLAVEQLENSSNSLHRLRSDLRDARGDLVLLDKQHDRPTRLQVTLPIERPGA